MDSLFRRLVAAAVLLGAVALRQKGPHEDAATALVGVRHLPQLDEFAKTWSAMTLAQDRVPILPGVNLVMGIFSTAEEAPFRRVVRQTWMTQPGVCKAAKGPQKDCGVYVTFAQAETSAAGGHEHRERDTVFLPLTENMDEGKTLEYFRIALMHYPWATHLGKMDTDAFPKWGPILNALKDDFMGCESYMGRPWKCDRAQHDYCAPMDCGPPMGGYFRVRDTDSHCWSYMQGGLYIVSRNLLSKATERNGHWDKHKIGPEDVLAGHAIMVTSKKYNLCVRTWPQALVQSNVTHFHYFAAEEPDPCPCHSAEWAAYYRRSWPNWHKAA